MNLDDIASKVLALKFMKERRRWGKTLGQWTNKSAKVQVTAKKASSSKSEDENKNDLLPALCEKWVTYHLGTYKVLVALWKGHSAKEAEDYEMLKSVFET